MASTIAMMIILVIGTVLVQSGQLGSATSSPSSALPAC
jgi:preprotein translocase subunit SecG